MENIKDNSCDIFESNNNSFRIITRSQSRKTSRKRKVLWAEDLTEVMEKTKWKAMLLLPIESQVALKGKLQEY